MAADVNLLEEETGQNGVTGEYKASAGHSPWGCGGVPTTPPLLALQPTLGHCGLGTFACLPTQPAVKASCLDCPNKLHAHMGDKVRQLQE